MIADVEGKARNAFLHEEAEVVAQESTNDP